MYKLVPVVATDEMLAGGTDVAVGCCVPSPDEKQDLYTVMLDAAPNPWRPISEAEEYKDGRQIDVWHRSFGRIPNAYWRDGQWCHWWTDDLGSPGHVCIGGGITHFIPLEWLGSPEDGQ